MTILDTATKRNKTRIQSQSSTPNTKTQKISTIMILNPTKEIIRKYTKKLINSCTQSPNKEIKNPTTTRNKKKQRKFNINYKPT